MTKQEAIVVSAYTGFLMCDFNEIHKYIEEKLGRPVFTHELYLDSVQDEIHEKVKPDFLKICEEANKNSEIESKPKRGEWVWNPDGMDFGIGAWVCGNCRAKPNSFWEDMRDINPLRFAGSRYCPNCGADMRAKMEGQE